MNGVDMERCDCVADSHLFAHLRVQHDASCWIDFSIDPGPAGTEQHRSLPDRSCTQLDQKAIRCCGHRNVFAGPWEYGRRIIANTWITALGRHDLREAFER